MSDESHRDDSFYGSRQPRGPEKRAAPRRAWGESLRFHVTEPHFFVGVANDISTGGIFVQTLSLPRLDDVVTVRFRVPYLDEEHEARAWVVWTRPVRTGRAHDEVGFGGRFMNLSQEVFDAINRFVLEQEAAPE